MPEYVRYAVYYAPEANGTFATFGAAWLGWDAETGTRVPHPEIAGLPAAVSDLTTTPRKYGFHGTLKVPFRLADGFSQEDLEAAMSEFAARRAAFDAPPLQIAVFESPAFGVSEGGFVALVPSTSCEKLDALAFSCVSKLDDFRMPLSDSELEHHLRSLSVSPTPRQQVLLRRWGYPYVDDEFRFHLTLTSTLAPDVLYSTKEALAEVVEPFCAGPLPVREICLFAEDEEGQFHILQRFPLGST